MKMLFDFIMPLSFWEKMALLVITIGALALLVDLLLKAKKAKKNSKMVKKYLLAIKRTKEINESNYQTVLDLLLKQK